MLRKQLLERNPWESRLAEDVLAPEMRAEQSAYLADRKKKKPRLSRRPVLVARDALSSRPERQ